MSKRRVVESYIVEEYRSRVNDLIRLIEENINQEDIENEIGEARKYSPQYSYNDEDGN